MTISNNTLPLPSIVPGFSNEAYNRIVTATVAFLPEVKDTGRPRTWSNEGVVWLVLYHVITGIDASDLAIREGQSKRNTQKWIKEGKVAMLNVLPVLPNGGEITERQQVLNWCEEHGGSLLVDGTEFGVEHPENSVNPYGEKQKPYFSGKKKTHTVKAQVLSDADGNVVDVGEIVPGSVHDYNLLLQSDWLPLLLLFTSVLVGGDSAYVGLNETLSSARTPRKKKPGTERTDDDRLWNTAVSSWRVAVEHAIGKIKRFKALRKVKLRITQVGANVRLAFLLVTYQQAWGRV